jgi:hypothetical protein
VPLQWGYGIVPLGVGNRELWLQVVAMTPLHVLTVPVEQLVLADPEGVMAALRHYLSLQLTYWFSRCGMISKHVRTCHAPCPCCRPARSSRCCRDNSGQAFAAAACSDAPAERAANLERAG